MEKFRDILVEIQSLVEGGHGATESDLKGLWNSLSTAITNQEQANGRIITDVKCNLCEEEVNNLAGNPAKWGVNLPMVQKDKTIKEAAHHYQCILFKLYPKCNCSKCTGLPSPEDYYKD